MVDITSKATTLRTAIAQAVVKVGSKDTIKAIQQGKVPKGNVFEISKAAGLFAAKKTSEMIPDCHPLPIESTTITHEIQGDTILVKAKIKTVYKTGVEVEAMHTVSVVALTMYDMLKPIDKHVEIENIKLLIKTGGKSEYENIKELGLKASIIVCSDSVHRGQKIDKVTNGITEKLELYGIDVVRHTVLPDEKSLIQTEVKSRITQGDRLIVLTGGTGLTPRDSTPEAIIPLLDKRIPGIEETMRDHGQQRMPYAMLSRSVAGIIGESLIIAMPGSSRGVKESLDVLFPHILHIFRIMKVT